MFIAALCTRAKTWKQPKCPSRDGRIKKMWYIYIHNGILLSHKKEWDNVICSNMDRPRDDHTMWSKPERERQIPYNITYVWNLKRHTNELIYETQSHRHREQTCDCQEGGGVGEGWIGSLGLADANYYI